jgi:hypothetical protein
MSQSKAAKVAIAKNEIKYHLINSALAGALVFFGSCTGGEMTWRGAIIAAAAAVVVGITKFQTYWSSVGSRPDHWKAHIFTFV